MVKELEGSWRGAGGKLEGSWSSAEEPSCRGFLMEHQRVRLPARDFQLLFIPGTAKESKSRIPDCFGDLWRSPPPFLCATSTGTKLLSQKPVLSTCAKSLQM